MYICIYLSLHSNCDLSAPGEANSFRPLTVGVCSNPFVTSYTLVMPTGYNSYTIQVNCTDSTCTQCSPPVTVALNVCNAPSPYFSYVLTSSRCQGAVTNPALASNTSITVLWRNNTLSCINATHANVQTFGTVSASLICLPFAYGTYAGLKLNSNGTYSGGVWCNLGCTSCTQPIYGLSLNSCLSNSVTNASINIQYTSTLNTCYVPPQTVFLSYLNNGSVNYA